ncbi:uncharacterized protein LOC131875177 [Cryptomeria japonica]|uniref:uncharacterized protein LOC131875177 n=1 Tax=Cryptomeria japonica TaxID=3369 RepID=UPI0027DA37B7|nr:uncharacterized protein LOC131875177 [Cryptomeria japonica]
MIEDEVKKFVSKANTTDEKRTNDDTTQPLPKPFFQGEGSMAINNRTQEVEETVIDASLINKHREVAGWVEEAIVRGEKSVESLDEDGSLRDLIKEWWSGAPEVIGTKAFVFVKKLQFVKSKTKEWNRIKSGNIFANKIDLEERLAALKEVLLDKAEDINREAVDLFLALLSKESNINLENQQNGLNVILELITKAQNQALMKPIQVEEVRKAVFSMAGDKAPGPDGFPAFFYQTFWDIVGNDVWAIVEESQSKTSVAKELNCTLLALIPKVEHPTSFNEFRPISLCNAIYKVVSKVISNRLKPMLSHIISEEQSGFVPGRSIIEGIIIAREAIHTV